MLADVLLKVTVCNMDSSLIIDNSGCFSGKKNQHNANSIKKTVTNHALKLSKYGVCVEPVDCLDVVIRAGQNGIDIEVSR